MRSLLENGLTFEDVNCHNNNNNNNNFTIIFII